MSPDSNAVRWATAVHEAGHAILATVLGLQIEFIEIKPSDDSAGSSLIECSPQLGIVDQIALCEAGAEAAELFQSRHS